MRQAHRLLVSAAAGVIASAILVAEVWGQAEPAAPAASPAATQPADEMISLTLPDNLELKVLIDYVSQRLHVLIISTEDIGAQRVSIKAATKVPRSALMDILQSALQIKGFALVDGETAGVKKIVPLSSLPANARPATQPGDSAAVTRVFTLEHIDAASADSIVKLFLTQPGGNSVGIAPQRLLVVTDYVANMARLTDLIKSIDRPKTEVAIEFVKMQYADATQLAPHLAQILNARITAGGGAMPGMGPVEIAQDQRANQIVVVGPKPLVADVLELVKKIDIPSPLMPKTYRFNVIAPKKIDEMVKQLIGQDVASRMYQSAVDNDSRVLVAFTTDAIHKRIELLQKEMDIGGEQSPIKFYKLANTTAKDVLGTLRGIEGQEQQAGGEEGGYGLSGTKPPRERTTEENFRNRTTSFLTNPSASTQPGSSTPGSMLQNANGSGQTGDTGPRTLTFQTELARITADLNTNTIIVVGPPSVQDMYGKIIQTLDKRRPQVLIECIIVTLNTTDNFSFGVDISRLGGFNASDLLTFSSFGLSKVNTKTGRLSIIPGTGFNGALISSDIADIVVRALATNNRARVVSAPRILVNDNTTGTLESLAEAPFTSINANNVVSTTSFAGYQSAGTFVTLTPHISDADYLQLEYTVSLNNFTGSATANSPPPRTTDAVESAVTIPDGSTIVVGGLNRRNYTKNVDSIPILGQIPILEYLFSNRTQTDEQSTLFVFIRPIILRDDRFEDLKYLSARDVHTAGVTPDEPESEPLILR